MSLNSIFRPLNYRLLGGGRMNLFDDENKIIEHFQLVDNKEVFLPDPNDEIEMLYKSIHDKAKWMDWTYCAGKNDPPPDYYNCKTAVMMDVMRVDDHAFISEKGKIVKVILPEWWMSIPERLIYTSVIIPVSKRLSLFWTSLRVILK